MTKQDITIRCQNTGETRDFPFGLTLREICETFALKPTYPFVNARVNNQSSGLGFRIFGSKDVEFLDVTDFSGMRTYTRSLCMVLCKAVYDLVPQAKIRIEHPMSGGYYCKVDISGEAAENGDYVLPTAAEIKARMGELIADNLPFQRIELPTEEAIARFGQQGMDDKVLLLETLGTLYTVLYELNGYADYFYGPLLQRTGELQLFDLVSYYDGMLLCVPQRKNPTQLQKAVTQEKMWETFQEYLSWQKIMNLSNVGDLNTVSASDKAGQLICVGEALQEKRIVHIAGEIATRMKTDTPPRIVLISGPSSSGKTTFSRRLSEQLLANGLRPYPVSLDDYFVCRENTPLDETGAYDYESLYALDLKLFNQHLHALMDGEEVELPTYNFITGKREYQGKRLRLDNTMVLLLEGIHALNPELTPQVPDMHKYRIYVSALTTMSLDDHNWIPTTDTRLVRRIIRDAAYRGRSAAETIAGWNSVRDGEDKWIFPFQENADVMFNSALLYEFAILRHYAEPLLQNVPQNIPQYAEASRLLNFLQHFTPFENDHIPLTSLMREFVGGSIFRY